MVSDWTLTYWVLSLVAIQLTTAWIMRDASWFRLIIAAYCIGGTCNHSLALAMHELAHNLAFGFLHYSSNRWLAWVANMPIGLPAASSFKKYHLEHHKYQGNNVIDADLPTTWEARIFTGTLGKCIWMFLQPLFYAFRPLVAYPKPATRHEVINFTVQMTFNALLVYFAGWKSLIYLIAGTLLGYGIHPISGHFISEHYMFIKGVETYSYYGPLNFLTYNVGYHNEHHDFPNVPGRLLPEITKTAPEFYSDLPSYRSWSKVLFDFATDPTVSLWSRIKRAQKDKDDSASTDSAISTASGSPVSSLGSTTSSASSSPVVVEETKLHSYDEDDLLPDNDADFVIRQRRE